MYSIQPGEPLSLLRPLFQFPRLNEYTVLRTPVQSYSTIQRNGVGPDVVAAIPLTVSIKHDDMKERICFFRLAYRSMGMW